MPLVTFVSSSYITKGFVNMDLKVGPIQAASKLGGPYSKNHASRHCVPKNIDTGKLSVSTNMKFIKKYYM